MDPCKSLHLQQLAVEGKSQVQIAKVLGISPSTVSRQLSSDKVKDKIDYCRSEIVEKAYQSSVQNVVKSISEYDKPAESKEDLMRREHGFKASLRILESMGLIESRTQPAFVQNILVQNNNQYFSPLTEKALSNALNVIDSEVIEGDED